MLNESNMSLFIYNTNAFSACNLKLNAIIFYPKNYNLTPDTCVVEINESVWQTTRPI